LNLIDLKYSGILSARIEGFVVKSNSPYRANMRCPLCGDSQKSKRKKRGWILEKDNSAWYYCHNCHASHPLRKFIEEIDPPLAKEYVVDMGCGEQVCEEASEETSGDFDDEATQV
jgi:transcription elongation factor Elf1